MPFFREELVVNVDRGIAVRATSGSAALAGSEAPTMIVQNTDTSAVTSNPIAIFARSELGEGFHGETSSARFAGVAGISTNPTPDPAGTLNPAGVFGKSQIGEGVHGETSSARFAGVLGINLDTEGTGAGVHGEGSGAGPGVLGKNHGTGWAGEFQATNPSAKGVRITTMGGTGLTVAGGTTSTEAPTSRGARSLYSEAATEVWLTDYGFGRLTQGVAHIRIDSLFTDTVNLQDNYHVFIQPYGDSLLFVSSRTEASFEVHSPDPSSDIEFSYRIVAKRRGCEHLRLDAAAP